MAGWGRKQGALLPSTPNGVHVPFLLGGRGGRRRVPHPLRSSSLFGPPMEGEEHAGGGGALPC